MTAEQFGWRRLGTVLVEAGLLGDEDLTQALTEQDQTGELLGTILVKRGLVSAAAIANALAEQYGAILRSEHGFGTGLRAVLESGAPDAANAVPEPPISATEPPEAASPIPSPKERVVPPPDEPAQPDTGHLLFVPTSQGYLLLARSGTAPSPGQTLELPETAVPMVVAKIASSPLPSDPRQCAYLQIL